MWLTRIRQEKEARAQAKELFPTTEWLFGGQIKTLAQDLKTSTELNPLAIDYGKKRGSGNFRGRGFRGSGAGGSFSYRGRGASNAVRGRGSSSGRGSRLSKFKDN